ncbi:hypothetical protein A1354_15945 [Pseudomonas asplenii]|nr:hypothetical protein [Pseudomonas asplenii]PNG44636.1 hypothetical protein A1354_15945 [Pseudomonas asplenii]
MSRGVIFISFASCVFFFQLVLDTLFSHLGSSRHCQWMDYAPETTPQIGETVRKVETTRVMEGTNGPLFGIRHP